MEALNPGGSTGHPSSARGARIGAVVAIVGVLALVSLIVRELMPHHATTHATSSAAGDESTSDAPPIAAPAPTVHGAVPAPVAKPKVAVAAPAAPTAAAGAKVPIAATVIAQVAADPTSFAPSHVFSPPAGKEELYNYEPLPPFNSTTLKRSKTNPGAWELDAMHGPKMTDLGPEGAVHQAVLVKDSIGNETPWYVIDSGPLAPAYAVMQGNSMRVMSREFMVENRADLPADVAATLGK